MGSEFSEAGYSACGTAVARSSMSLLLCPETVGPAGVKVSRPNFHQERTGKDTNFLQGATAKVGNLMALWVLSKSKVSPLTFNSSKTSNACLKFYASCSNTEGVCTQAEWKG